MDCERCGEQVYKTAMRAPGYVNDYLICELCTVDLRIGIDLWLERYEKDYERWIKGAEEEGLDVGRKPPRIIARKGGANDERPAPGPR